MPLQPPPPGSSFFQVNDTTGFYYYTGSKWVVVSAEALSINDLVDGKTIGNSVFLGAGAGDNDVTDLWNVAIGVDALKVNTTGFNNIAIGYLALNSNTTGLNNTANGSGTLYSNTAGKHNTANGSTALFFNTTGDYNTASGSEALYDNTTGYQNTALGYRTLYDNTTGYQNTALGSNALKLNKSGFSNTVIGYQASSYNKTGSGNTAIGYEANYKNEDGSNNTIIGYEAGWGLLTHNKSGNIFLGYKAGFNETGDNKLYIENSDASNPLIWGDFANDSVRINGTLDINNAFAFPTTDGTTGQILQTNGNGTLNWADNLGATALQWPDTTNQLATDYDVSQKQNISDTSTVDATRYWVGQQGYLNTVAIDSLTDGKSDGSSVFLGSGAGTDDDISNNENVGVGIMALRYNTSGYRNTATGNSSLFLNTTGSYNSANGYQALWANRTGNQNTANGDVALLANTTGSWNTAIGSSALLNNSTGNNNTGIGCYSLYSNTEGSENTAIGYKSIYKNTLGGKNTAIGHMALDRNTIGNNNTANGYKANYYNQEGSNNTIIGFEAGMGTSNHNKSGNVFLGYQSGYYEGESNKLYIENSNSSTPLIWGDFANDSIRINGTLDINNAFAFPTTDGSTGQILQTNGSGTLNWADNPGATALQWPDTTNQLATDYDVSQKQNISDTSSVDATRYWVGQQGYLNTVAIDSLTDGKTGGGSVFLGHNAGTNDDGIDNYNVAVGEDALKTNTSGIFNTAHGYQALYLNSTGAYNTAIGKSSLRSNTEGGNNTASGTHALFSNSTGQGNTANGASALHTNSTGNYNTVLGGGADYNNGEGSGNTIIGFQAGFGSGAHNKSGSILLGYQAGYNEHGNNKLYIENSNSSTPLIWGDFANDTVRINGTLDVAGNYSFPDSDGTGGQIMQTDGSGNLSWIANPGSTALQWSDTTNKLATDYNVSLKQNISDTSSVDATRYWVSQQGYLTSGLQWSDTSNQLATDYNISFKQNISDTSTLDATRYWVGQQSYITGVGSMTAGDVFAGSSADDQWLGLGASAGRIEFDYLTTDEVNILDANVGIGTSSPSSLLEVYDGTLSITKIATSTHEDAIKIGADGEYSANIKFYDDDFESTEHFKISFNALTQDLKVQSDQENNILYLTETGNIGIGTWDPSSKLEVYDGIMSVTNIASSTHEDAIKIGVDGEYDASIKLYDDDLESTQHFKMTFNALNQDLRFQSDQEDNILYMTESGDVGIGTSSPESKLQVDGGVQVGNDSDAASADKGGTIRYRVSGNTSYAEMCMQTGASSYSWVVIKSNSWL